MRRNGCAFFALLLLCACSTLTNATLVLDMSADTEAKADMNSFSLIQQLAEKLTITPDTTFNTTTPTRPIAPLLINPADNTESLCTDCDSTTTVSTLKTISASLSARTN